MKKITLADEPDFAPIAGYRAKMIHSDQMSIAHWTVEPGYELPEHSHPHEQITNIIEGEFILVLEGEEIHLSVGESLVIPGGAKHSGKSLTDCKIIDVWNPPRDDYRQNPNG
ncbi:cupin domain-containing protein [Mariniblastus fucicola]|uniref:HTH-type transcriptional regulator PuuR n=1 Tax=Mariniblastus fucicola TaxID=980251 RepID=A0A5B9P6K9_9BACT|nr:cupin domain-containing protein [Mariniblastus fucicola]QEG21179.1 HTH-type transcriptional regulator PuuR [Mariniblastus fucicola]